MLKPGSSEGDEALEYYAKHTAQIEVRTPLCNKNVGPLKSLLNIMTFLPALNRTEDLVLAWSRSS